MTDPMPALSIVIPVLDERAEVEPAIESLRASIGAASADCEIIVVDGGSCDGTLEWFLGQRDLRLLQSPPGRARQLNFGAANAKGGWLLFLHADARVEPELLPGLIEEIRRLETTSRHLLTFRLAFRGDRPIYRRMEAGVRWRTQKLALPYGDQGFAVPAPLFRQLGGFDEQAQMEDLDFVLRLRSYGVLRLLPFTVSTSARQYERQGPLWAMVYNLGRLAAGVLLFYLRGPYPRRPEQKGERSAS